MDSPSSPAPLTGGCLCGAVRYEARPDKREGYYCHCRMCQLAFGNTRATFINLPKEQVRWSGVAPAWYASSTFARRGFCGRCGTPLAFEFLDSPRMDLSIGSLDEPTLVKPVLHYAVESRIETWHADDGLPGERLDQNEKITARWKAAYGDDVKPGVEAVRVAGASG
jgi:hypothetical protein